VNKTFTKGGPFHCVLEFPSTSCCSQKFPPNKIENLASWTCEVVSGMLTLGGQWGMEWRAKVKEQNGARTRIKPKNQPGKAVLAP